MTRELIKKLGDALSTKYDAWGDTAHPELLEEVEKALAQPEQSEPWNAVQVATWIGNKLMHEPSMFERREVCRYVRSLGREPQLAKHFASPLRELSESDIRAEFGKLYPNDIGILELAENNSDYKLEAIGARHHWTAFLAGAKAILSAARKAP